MKMPRLILSLAALLIAANPALAHTGIGGTLGFARGVAHPIGGIDHVLAMVAVGLFAAQLGGRALWGVPLAFVSLMALGSALAMAGISLPFVELGIALSIVGLGAAVATRIHLPTLAAMTLAGFFALFHGHAHGAEMPETLSGLAFGAGFVLATAGLHVAGIGLGLTIGKASDAFGNRVRRAAGSAMALAGLVMLTGYL
jgi:urease accessory protein